MEKARAFDPIYMLLHILENQYIRKIKPLIIPIMIPKEKSAYYHMIL